MSQHYLFPQPGVIPGIPGTFSGCRVDVDEASGTFQVRPLPQLAHVTEEMPLTPVESPLEAPPIERAEPAKGASEPVADAKEEEVQPAEQTPPPSPVRRSLGGK